jgi:tetratricopeptide (TPR) repeat protein
MTLLGAVIVFLSAPAIGVSAGDDWPSEVPRPDGAPIGGTLLDRRLQEHRDDVNERYYEQQQRRNEPAPQAGPRYSPGSQPAWRTAGALQNESHNLVLAGRLDDAIEKLRQAFKYVKDESSSQTELMGDWYVYQAAKFSYQRNFPEAIRQAKKAISDLGGQIRGKINVELFYAVVLQDENLYRRRVAWVQQLKQVCFNYAKVTYRVNMTVRCSDNVQECFRDHRIDLGATQAGCLASWIGGLVAGFAACGITVYVGENVGRTCGNVAATCRSDRAQTYAATTRECNAASE